MHSGLHESFRIHYSYIQVCYLTQFMFYFSRVEHTLMIFMKYTFDAGLLSDVSEQISSDLGMSDS